MRQAGVGRGKGRIQRDGAAVVRDRPRRRRGGTGADRRPPGEVGAVCVVVGGWGSGEPRALGAREPPAHGLDDPHCHGVLHGEHVPNRLIVGVRPHVVARRRFRHLDGDTHALARVPQGALQHVPHAQLAAHALRVGGTARPEAQCRVATRDAQPGNVAQPRDQLFGDAFGQGDVGRVARAGRQVKDGQRRRALDGDRTCGRRLGAGARRRRAVGALGVEAVPRRHHA